MITSEITLPIIKLGLIIIQKIATGPTLLINSRVEKF